MDGGVERLVRCRFLSNDRDEQKIPQVFYRSAEGRAGDDAATSAISARVGEASLFHHTETSSRHPAVFCRNSGFASDGEQSTPDGNRDRMCPITGSQFTHQVFYVEIDGIF